MASLANYPPFRPSLLLDFANSGRVDPRVTCTRATTATRFNKRGVLETVPANIPRIDYNPFTGECLGLFVEGGGTNLCLQSAPVGITSPWTDAGAFGTKSAITTAAPTLTAPDGTVSGIKVTAAASAGTRKIAQRISVAASTTYTASVWTYVVSGVWRLQISTGLNNVLVSTVAADVQAVSAASGWSRISVSYTVPSSGVNQLEIGLTNLSGSSAGEATIWGAQLEASAFAFSYTPTTTAAVTRSSDLVQMLGDNFSDWYRPEGGTFVVQGSRLTTAGALIALGSSSTGTRMALYGNGPAVQIVIDGTTQVQSTISGGVTPAGTTDISAVAMALDDFAFVKNGGTVGTDTAGLIQSPTAPFNRLHIGSAAWANPAADYLGGYIRRIAYYPSRLSNAQIQMLTAP